MAKILITGATGFIGSHLVELCAEKGYDVVAFDRYNPNNDLGWLKGSAYRQEINFQLGDIRDYDSVAHAMHGCDVVFHLAALIGIPYSYVSPLAYIRTNVEGTYNVLESAKNKGVEQILVTSTSEVYGTAQYTPIDEFHPLVGQSPYAATKISADQLALSYFRSFDLPVKVVRPFNTYGPRQSARAVIPTIISQCQSGTDNILLGNITPERDLTFVADTCSAFLEIQRADCFYGEVINVGMNTMVSIEDLARKVMRVMGVDLDIVQDKQRVRPLKSEVDRLVCDNAKIKDATNWRPSFNLDRGLAETIHWFTENPHFLPDREYLV